MKRIDEIIKKHLGPNEGTEGGEKRFDLNATIFSRSDAKKLEKVVNKQLSGGPITNIKRLSIVWRP